MKIAFVINKIENGGAEHILINFLIELSLVNPALTLIVLSSQNQDESMLAKLKDSAVRVIQLSMGSIYNPFLVFKLRAYFLSLRPDIIHVHLFPSIYWSFFANSFLKKKSKLVFTEHSTVNRRIKNRFLKWVEIYIYAGYDLIIAISPFVYNNLILFVKPHNIVVIPNGIHLKEFQQATKTPIENLSLNIPADSTVLLMTARFEYPKNQASAIRLCHLLPDNYYFLFAGLGSQLVQCQQLAERLNIGHRVKFLGLRNDVAVLMKSVNINLLISEYEGLSTATIESMASEQVFLGSNIPGISDVVGSSDSLFLNNDLDSLSRYVVEVSGDSRLRKSIVSKNILKSLDFDISIMIASHLNVYQRLLI